MEALVACLLMALVLPPVVSSLGTARRNAEAMTRRAEANSTVRGVFTLLMEELRRTGGTGPHATLSEPDRLGLRAFRATGLPCGPGLASEGGAGSPATLTLTLLHSGTRLPDPRKDSVEAVLPDGTLWRTAVWASERTPECGGGLTVTLEGIPEGYPLILRFYERGEYSLSDGAFRYRRGGGGRQPLTPERIGEGIFEEASSMRGFVRVRLQISPDLPGRTARDMSVVLGGGR
jgi:type II secretory pathway component PulJ